jgi:hypothetical protein
LRAERGQLVRALEDYQERATQLPVPTFRAQAVAIEGKENLHDETLSHMRQSLDITKPIPDALRRSAGPMAHGTLFIGHCSSGIAHFGTDLARLGRLQVGALLDESIEPPQMLGSFLKSLRIRSDLAPTDPDINAQ